MKLKIPEGLEGIKKRPICIHNTLLKEARNYVGKRIGWMVISQIHLQEKIVSV